MLGAQSMKPSMGPFRAQAPVWCHMCHTPATPALETRKNAKKVEGLEDKEVGQEDEKILEKIV